MDFDISSIRTESHISEGLRAYLSKVYSYMAGALTLSGVCAYLASLNIQNNIFYTINNNQLSLSLIGWVAVIAPLFLVWMISSASAQLNKQKATVYFWTFSALMGVSLSNIFLLYTTSQIAQAFVVTAGAFYALTLYAKNTSKDLSAMGTFCFIGLIGLIITSIFAIFIASSFLNLAISVVAVLIFAGLTAYDAQRIRNTYYQCADNQEALDCAAITGALSLYINFINLFRNILILLNDRK